MVVDQNSQPKPGSDKNAALSGPDNQRKLLTGYFPTVRAFMGWLMLVGIGFFCLLSAFTAHHLINPGLKVGDVADKDIRAKQSTIVEDEGKTRDAQEAARRNLIPAFKEDKDHYQETLAAVRQSLGTITSLKAAGIEPLTREISPDNHLSLLLEETLDKNSRLVKKLSKTTLTKIEDQKEKLAAFRATHERLSNSEMYLAIAIAPEDWSKFSNAVEASAARACRILKRFPAGGDVSWLENVIEFLPEQMPANVKARAAILITAALKPNYIVDEEATRRKESAVVAAIKPEMRQITQGEIILRKGDLVTEDNVRILSAAGAVSAIRWRLVFSLTFSLFAGAGLVGLYLYIWEPKHFYSAASLGLMFTVCVLTASAAAAIGKAYPQFVPMPSAALVLTIFFGRRVALAIIFPALLLLAIDRVIDVNHLVALGTASGAAIGTYSRQRHDLVFSGLIIGMMQALGYVASLALIPSVSSPAVLGKLVTLEFFGGVTSTVVAIGSLPFLENIFGVLTPSRLAELTNADQPLLRKLEEEAPGTYQHSLAVANLAEAGARSIRADVNLVRAGALYHDVGKMARPRYFIENQLGDKNPHDSMSPEQSRERVLAHVTDGLVLAQKHAIPKAIQDFIPMHQGTSLMAYFFHKACLRDGLDKVDPATYRYPGPKPQSKETAIVMLADVSEAVTHSMTEATQEEVEVALTRVFDNRWQDGQFEESTLTHAELEKVKTAFLRVWRTLHHERLKYPSTTTGRMPIPPEGTPAPKQV